MEPVGETSIEELPLELLDSIFAFIVRPSDLKALCLVSKATSEPAFRHLYRSITLAYSRHDHSWTRVERLSQSQHLYHVQSIDIGQSDLPGSFLFCKNLQPLLRNLPLDALKSFTYGLHGRPQAEDLIAVWREHRNLRKLQLDFNLVAPSLREMVQDSKDNLRSLTSVEELEVDFGQELDVASSLALFDLLQTQRLRSIKLQHSEPAYLRTNEQCRAFSTLGTALVSCYFPTTLTSISLTFVCLPSPENWKLSEYHALLALELYECSNMESILDSIEKPNLKHFHIERRNWSTHNSMYLSTRSFLKRFGSLETLSVDIEAEVDNGEKLVPAIREHGLHLKSLWIGGHSEEPGPSVLNDKLDAYPQLKYLALPLRMDVMMVERCKRILRQLPQLEVLVVNQSGISAAELSKWRDESSRLSHVQVCAAKIFSRMPTGGKLRLLVFAKVPSALIEPLWRTGTPHAWRYCFIQAKDEIQYGRCSSTRSLSDQRRPRAESSVAVQLDVELARYMFPGAGARLLG